MRRIVFSAVIVLAIFAGAEGLARLAFQFPLFDADDEVGYWPMPDQHGTFLFINDWAFDGDSLGVEEEFGPSSRFDVLLIGDSIVYGGNSMAQDDKLGPMIERHTNWQLWPVAAGGWGLQNELAFLRRKPELAQGADAIVFVLNSGDFADAASWLSPYTHPREQPSLYLEYLFRRYALPIAQDGTAPNPLAKRDVLRDWLEFAESTGKPIYAVAYSTRAETGANCDWVPPGFKQVGEWTCHDGFAIAGAQGFRDEIHPSVEGNYALAKRIEATIRGNEAGETR